MSYTVIWKPAAEDELARLWTDGPDRADVAAAADRIDDLRRRNPEAEGESRSGALRILVLPPLAVHFKILADDRQVHVLDVWRWGPAPASE